MVDVDDTELGDVGLARELLGHLPGQPSPENRTHRVFPRRAVEADGVQDVPAVYDGDNRLIELVSLDVATLFALRNERCSFK